MLEPRRLAARAAAFRMAQLISENIGETVGYRIRLETRVSSATRIEVVTEGVLTRMLLHDPTLEGYAITIFDEFHERSLHADTALALTVHTKRLVRPDLRLLVMSATLDGTAIANHIDAAVLKSEGRQFPVETRYIAPTHGKVEQTTAPVVRRALRETAGDVLVFLPGAPEIRRTLANLISEPLPPKTYVVPLYGMLSQEEQDRAISPSRPSERKVVLATSIAETSLTIEGVRAVVDSGLARIPHFSARVGMTRLQTVRVSRAAADQRCGRAGRLAPGVCYRLWHQHETPQLLPAAPPEILHGDLVPLALDLAVVGITDPLQLTWLDPPPSAAYAQAMDLLRQLAAIDETGHVSEHGRRMASLAMHPRLAHMVLRASTERLGALACDLAALLSERDLLRADRAVPDTDIRHRLDLIREPARGDPAGHSSLQRIREQSRSWRALVGAGADDYDRDATGRVLALAYPDRVAQRRPGSTPRFVLRNGIDALLPEGDALSIELALVVAESDGKSPHARVFLAAPLSFEDILRDFADQIQTEEVVTWDDQAGVVRAREERRLGAIVLGRRTIDDPDPASVARAIADAARRYGLTMLPWSDSAKRLRERIRFLSLHDSSWPDVSDPGLLSSLFGHLVPQLVGLRSRNELRRIDLHAALLDLLTWEQRSRVESLAPTHYVAPSGSRIPIDYGDPEAPAVNVRLQEMFGCATTPAILAGRVPLTLRLLSPSHRPVQVTRDLAGFWRSSYFDVRKDLRGRYPKHHWPDDPVAATPTARSKRSQ
jgi:ATP-dependent helicase HrpB